MKIAIVGAGKLGRIVATALLGGDHSVTLIDTNEEVAGKRSALRWMSWWSMETPRK